MTFGSRGSREIKMVSRILTSSWIVIFLIIFVSGCQSTGTQDEDSPNFRVPTDSIFVLNQELIVAERMRRVYFQFGRTLARHNQVRRQLSWCVLRLRDKKDTVQRIEPDKFIVRSVRQRTLFQVALIGPVKVAQRRRSDATFQVSALEMELDSERQRDVVNLACARWRVPATVHHVTIRSIRETLGDIFTLQLATQDADY